MPQDGLPEPLEILWAGQTKYFPFGSPPPALDPVIAALRIYEIDGITLTLIPPDDAGKRALVTLREMSTFGFGTSLHTVCGSAFILSNYPARTKDICELVENKVPDGSAVVVYCDTRVVHARIYAQPFSAGVFGGIAEDSMASARAYLAHR